MHVAIYATRSVSCKFVCVWHINLIISITTCNHNFDWPLFGARVCHVSKTHLAGTETGFEYTVSSTLLVHVWDLILPWKGHSRASKKLRRARRKSLTHFAPKHLPHPRVLGPGRVLISGPWGCSPVRWRNDIFAPQKSFSGVCGTPSSHLVRVMKCFYGPMRPTGGVNQLTIPSVIVHLIV